MAVIGEHLRPNIQQGLFEPSEGELVTKAKSGDGQAIEALYNKYFPRIFGCGLNRTGSEEDSADLAGDTFVKFLETLERFEYRHLGALNGLLFTINCNLAKNLHRKKQRHPSVSLDEESKLFSPDSNDPAVIAERREEKIAVAEAVAELPKSQQTVIYYRFVEEKLPKDVAEKMGRTVGAVKSLQHRAEERLKNALKGKI